MEKVVIVVAGAAAHPSRLFIDQRNNSVRSYTFAFNAVIIDIVAKSEPVQHAICPRSKDIIALWWRSGGGSGFR